MTHYCLVPGDLDAARAMPPGDSRLREIEACPRCRQLLGSYAEFLDDRSAPAGLDRERVAEHLRREFDRVLAADTAAGEPLRGPSRAPAATVARARGARPEGRRWWAGLLRPPVAWAAAAALAAVFALQFGERWLPPGGGADALRASPETPRARAAGGLALFAPRPVAAGVELRWTSAPGADAYRVVFLGEELAQVATLDAGPDTLVVLARGELAGTLGPGRTIAWQVVAMQGGDPVASSGTRLLRVP